VNNQNETNTGMVGAGQMAKLLMLTPERLRQLAKEGAIPVAERGRYPLVQTIQAYLEWLRDDGRRAAQSRPNASLASAREKEIRLRLAQREAQIIDAIDVEAFHSFSSSLYRGQLAGLGGSVSRDPIIAGQIDAALTAALDRFDSRFAEAFPKLKRGIDPLGRRG